jgi:hypothetical protein
VWRHDTDQAAPARAKISRTGLAWALKALVVDHATISVIAAKLAVSWHTANDAILAEGHRVLIDDPARFDNVSVIGVDEHVWRHTRRGDMWLFVRSVRNPTSSFDGSFATIQSLTRLSRIGATSSSSVDFTIELNNIYLVKNAPPRYLI